MVFFYFILVGGGERQMIIKKYEFYNFLKCYEGNKQGNVNGK